MSTEEQDQILGRLIRQKADYKRELAALDAEIKRMAHHLHSVAEAMLRRCEAARKFTEDRLPALMISMDAEAWVNMESINRLIAQQEAAHRNYAEAVDSISRFD